MQFFLVFGLTFLLLSFVLPKPPAPVSPNSYALGLKESEVVVPNIAELTVHNNTSEVKQFEVCRDLEVRKDGQKISDLSTSAPSFCKSSVDIAPASKHTVELSSIDALFRQDAKISFRLYSSGTEVSQQEVSVEEQGFFRSLVTHAFYAPILNLFVWIISSLPTHSLGVAIILLTVVVRLVLLVPQHRSMVSARKMQIIQPKIKTLQDEYKDRPQELGLKMMELWKKEQVSPFGACLPLLIQIPFLSAIYFLLISVHDTTNAYYLYRWFEGFSFPSIDTIFMGVDLLQIGGVIGMISAIVLALAQYIQIKLSLAQSAKTSGKSQKSFLEIFKESAESGSAMPSQDLMGKFMLYVMPAIVGISALFFPLGLTLYWFIGNLFMIAQQLFANHVVVHLKKSKKVS